ncbi:hypothetical protein [Gimesia chilikensis]|uniref:SLA1 homology domain-containing protein n=1 Tax=Gimesia chilikensis TaxID=2605989 RepID=A0A517PL36_9PLAN|nr:hypothetical protein [Gimesia chilikensis]QDT20094.1 hypothetical protein HG66A1_18790 [Gimesia chilikensis]
MQTGRSAHSIKRQTGCRGLRCLLLLVVISLVPSLAWAEHRLWTSADGKNQVRGELKGTNGKLVILEKESDGKLHLLPLTELSQADQDFVRQKYPDIFAKENNGLPQATPEGKAAPMAPAMNGEKPVPTGTAPVDGRFNWAQVLEALPQFKLKQLEGAAILSDNAGLYTHEEQRTLRTSADHIGALMSYLVDREGYELLAKKMEEKGFEGAFNTTNGREHQRIEDCFHLFEDGYKLFYSKDDKNQYYDLRSSRVNDFDKGVQVASVIRKYAQDFQIIKYAGEAIPLAVFSPATLDNYLEDRGEFPLRVRGSLKHLKLRSILREVYLNSPEMPSGIKKTPAEAREFARQIEGKKLAFRKDVLLSNLRFEQHRRFLGMLREDYLVNVQIIRLSLVDAADPTQVIQSWDVKPAIEKPTAPPAEENQDLAQKMQQLAKQHGLVMWKGYPAVRADLTFSDEVYLGSDHRRFTGFLDRVALGLNPKHVSPVLLATHFPETIGTLVSIQKNRAGGIHSADWLGTNEFDRRDILKRFEQNYTDKLSKYAVELPIRFVEIRKVLLGFNRRYDFEREGVLIDLRSGNENFPGLTSGSFDQRDDKIKEYYRPCYEQQFLPLTPEQARPMFSQAGPGGCEAYLTRVVTWDRMQLKNDDENKLPPVSITTESLELYQDPFLKNQLATLEFKQLPPSILSEAKGQLLPGPDQPGNLDQYSLFLLKHELDGKNVDQAELEKLFEDYRYNFKSQAHSFGSDLYQLKQAEEAYSAHGTADLNAAPRDPAEKAKDIKEWQDAKKKVEQHFVNPSSPFFPLSTSQRNLDQKQLPELSKKWHDWMRQCLKSTGRRLIVHAGIKVDPQLRDVQLTVSHGGIQNPYTWGPTRPLIEQGIPADRLVILPSQDHLNLVNLTPCLQLEQPLETTFKQIPDDIRDHILERLNQTARLEMVVSIGEPRLLPDSSGKGQDGLLLPAQLHGIQLFNDQKLIFEYRLPETGKQNNTDQTASVSKTPASMPAEKNAVPADSGQIETFTPATSLRLIARYLPEFASANGGSLMFNRWRHESDFRAVGERSKFGLNPQRGVYFRPQAPRPEVEQLQAESAAFAKWLSRPESLPGNRYTLQFPARFLPLTEDVKGHRRAMPNARGFTALSNYGKVLSSIRSEISSRKRSIDTENFMNGNGSGRSKSGGGGGGIGGGLYIGSPNNGTTNTKEKPEAKNSKPSAKVLKYRQEIEELTRLLNYVESAQQNFYLHHISNDYGFTNLQGNLQAYGNNDLDVIRLQKIYEPIFPVLNLSHQIVLPQSLNLEPGRRDWPIELEFHITGASSQETPVQRLDPEITGKYSEQLKLEDHGKYVVFNVEVKGAWLIDQKTGQRSHALNLVPLTEKQTAK